MNAIDRLRTPPMLIGLGAVLLLLMAVAGVVGASRELSAPVAAPHSVGRAVMAVDHIVIAPATIPALGTVQTDAHGDRWVWLGRAWVACQHIDPATMTYNSINTDPAITDWHRLPTGDKQKVVEVCR